MIQELIGGGMQIGGGILTGTATAEQNAANLAAKKRLEWEIENLEELQQPLGASLLKGYRPGGELRDALLGSYVAPAVRSAKLAKQGAEVSSSEYGGRDVGAAGRRARSADIGKAVGYVQGSQLGGIKADTSLANMYLTGRGLASDFAPQSVGQDRANIGEFLSSFGSTIGKPMENQPADEMPEW